MLSVSQLGKSYAGRILFRGVSFHLNGGERIGLVGPNGAGKSTLFSLILGDAMPDEGEVRWRNGSTVGFLPQESAPGGEQSVLGLALSHVPEGCGWEAEPKAKRILRGLAFRERDFDRPAKTLSGGWIMRAHLARLLVQEPDLLLLDEPTNHLDLESLLWFQNYLRSYPGAVLLISHDREFLNHVVGSVLEISGLQILRYTGNYDDYVREKIARDEQRAAAFENQQREIARLQSWVDRFRAKNTFASRAQDKLKLIERMNAIEAPKAADKTVRFRFPQPRRSGQRVVSLKSVSFAYPTSGSEGVLMRPIYDRLNYEIERGQRIALVGPNGAGKSTLLKLLAGVLTPQQGIRETGFHVQTGYFSQHRAETLNLGHTVLESALDMRQPVAEQLARNLLGAFLFRGDDVFKPVGVLSGGEKSRLALVKLLLDPPNFLLMDEPTTHLDIASIDALIEAIEQFDGTLVFISHDVHFIRRMADTVVHIDAGRLTIYAGDYQYYLDKTRAGSAREALTARLGDHRPEVLLETAADRAAHAMGGKSREQRRREAEERNARGQTRRALEARIADIEERISAKEARRSEILRLLQSPGTYSDAGVVVELNRELAGIDAVIERLSNEWEQVATEFESLQAASSPR